MIAKTSRTFIWLLLFLQLSVAVCGDTTSTAPRLEGKDAFKIQIKAALKLLQEKAPDSYLQVCKQIAVIKQAKHSGMWADRTPTELDLADPTSFYSITWCASAIAHDSLHAKLRQDYVQKHPKQKVPDSVWIGVEAEKKCIEYQLAVLKKIGAPRHEIKHCKRQNGTHHDVNNDGHYTWEDFEKRNW